MARPSAPRPPATPDLKTAADLAPVLPMTFEVKDGHLWIGGVDMVALAREAGTALYVMDEATIRHQLSEYVKWTQFHWKDVDVVYAGKAFLSLAMIKLVEEEGCCLLCASGGELAYAKRAGFPMSRVQVHGNNKTPAELADCVEAGVSRVVVDNFDELERLSAIADGARRRAADADPRHAGRGGRHARLHHDRRRGLEVRLRAEPGACDGGGQARGRVAGHRLRRAAHAHRQPDLRAAQLRSRHRGHGRLHARHPGRDGRAGAHARRRRRTRRGLRRCRTSRRRSRSSARSSSTASRKSASATGSPCRAWPSSRDAASSPTPA